MKRAESQGEWHDCVCATGRMGCVVLCCSRRKKEINEIAYELLRSSGERIIGPPISGRRFRCDGCETRGLAHAKLASAFFPNRVSETRRQATRRCFVKGHVQTSLHTLICVAFFCPAYQGLGNLCSTLLHPKIAFTTSCPDLWLACRSSAARSSKTFTVLGSHSITPTLGPPATLAQRRHPRTAQAPPRTRSRDLYQGPQDHDKAGG